SSTAYSASRRGTRRSTCESRRDARCADRGVRPTRGPAEDAELLDSKGIGELNHVARPGTKRAPREYVRPSNPGTVDRDQAHVRRGCDSFVGTPHPRVRRAVEHENAAALRFAPLGICERAAVAASTRLVRE